MNTNKITISKFIEEYNKLNGYKAKGEFVETHIINKYSSIILKKKILDTMCEKSIVDVGNKYIDYTIYSVNFAMSILYLYTDIVPEKDLEGMQLSFDAYDKLVSSGAYEQIKKIIGKDIEELTEISNQTLITWEKKITSTEAFIRDIVELVSAKIGVVAGAGMKELASVISNEEKTEKFKNMLTDIINTTTNKLV